MRELLHAYGFPGDEVAVRPRQRHGGASDGGRRRRRARCIDELMDALDAYVPVPLRDEDKPFLMPIEGVHTIEGVGTVVTGRVERGAVRLERRGRDRRPGRRQSRKVVVTGLETFHDDRWRRRRPATTSACLLRGVKRDEVERGQVLAAAGVDHAAHAVRGARSTC